MGLMIGRGLEAVRRSEFYIFKALMNYNVKYHQHSSKNPVEHSDLKSLCLGVLKHMDSLARGPILLPKNVFTMDFCLCGAILNLKAFCFGAIPDIMIELTACVGLRGLTPSGSK